MSVFFSQHPPVVKNKDAPEAVKEVRAYVIASKELEEKSGTTV
jgi:hypothetical protein